MVLFPVSRDGRLTIARDAKFGGPLTYDSYEQMEADYLQKKLFPLDLKLVSRRSPLPARALFPSPLLSPVRVCADLCACPVFAAAPLQGGRCVGQPIARAHSRG